MSNTALSLTGLSASQAALARRGIGLRRVALFLAMLASGGMLLFPRIPMLLVMVVLCRVVRGSPFRLQRRVYPVFILLGVILVVAVLRPDDPLSTLIRLGNFLAALVLLDMYLTAGPRTLQKDLHTILRWMAVQALLTAVLAQFFSSLFRTLRVQGTAYSTLFYVFNYHRPLEASTALNRPDGFFYEPGIFQCYLNIYLYLALFVFRSPLQSIVALAAVLSTRSTTGVIICAVLLAGFGLQQVRKLALSRSAVFLIGIVLVAGLAVGWVTRENIADKFSGESQGSSWAREYDLLTGLNVIAESPVLGIGFDYRRYQDAAQRLGFVDTQLDTEETSQRLNTNGIVMLLYSLGIPLAVPFLIGMLRQPLMPYRWLFAVLLFATLSSESPIFTPFFLLFAFAGLVAPARRPRVEALPA